MLTRGIVLRLLRDFRKSDGPDA